MDYYKDLSYYSRFHFENAKNIGFAPKSQKKNATQLSEHFMPRLLKYLKYPLNSMRGGAFRTVEINNTLYTFGFSEIRVLDNKGCVYAAPDEIVADIAEGNYIPPAEFIDAVINGPDPDSNKYQAYLSRYKPECCWGASNEYIMDVVKLVEMISTGNLPGVMAQTTNRNALLDIVTGNGSLLNEAITRSQEAIAVYLLNAGICLEKFEGVELLTAVERGHENLVRALVEKGVPMKMDRPRNNPLFLAIGRHQNAIAEYLYATRKELVTTYSTEFATNCNILQWTKMCKNTDFMHFLETPL